MSADLAVDQHSNWVVVADEAEATFYAQQTRRAPLCEVLSLHNEKAQKKDRELSLDREGRSFDSYGRGRHAMSKEKTSPKRHAAGIFAKQIATHIAKARHDGRCRAYAVIAAPRFLGQLRDALSIAGIDKPYLTIDKEVVGQDIDTIQKLLDDGKERK